MNTYKYYYDLPLFVQDALYKSLKSSEFEEYENFELRIKDKYDNILYDIILDYGNCEVNSDNEEIGILILKDYVFSTIDNNHVTVLTFKEYESQGYISIPKIEYERLLKIEESYLRFCNMSANITTYNQSKNSYVDTYNSIFNDPFKF